MRIAGKLLGAIVGLILFHNPIGLLLGVLVGHFYDAATSQLRPPSMGSGFIEPLFGFAGALSKSDGRVSEVEIAATESLMARLRLDSAQRSIAISRFSAGKRPEFPVQLAIVDLKRWCGGRRDLAFLVLDLLLDLVYAEGALVEAKLALVRKLCASLGVNDQELAALSAMKGYAGASGGGRWRGAGSRSPQPGPLRVDAYAVLGIERSANEREIKRAYRKLMSQHHPDKLGDVPDELKQRAEDRAREINAAYERIKTERGFK
jgi:DnaJ like chaperone protein